MVTQNAAPQKEAYSGVQSGKDIPLSFVWLGIYVCTSFDREEEE